MFVLPSSSLISCKHPSLVRLTNFVLCLLVYLMRRDGFVQRCSFGQAYASNYGCAPAKEGSVNTPLVIVETQPIRSFPSSTSQVPVVELSETDLTESAESPKSES